MSNRKQKPARVARKPIYVQVADRLRERILTGQLQRGERLPMESDLAALLNVSRASSREALRLLASERLIETRRGVSGGVFVIHPNHGDVERSMNTAFDLMTHTGELTMEEILEAWLMMGPPLARLAAERRTDEQAAQLVMLAEPLPDSAGDEARLEAAREFSRLLLQMTDNRLIPLLIRPLLSVVPLRLREQRKAPGWWRRNAVEQLKLARAIEKRAPQEAFDEMTRHIQKYRNNSGAG